ncbi:proline--tRNA ligase [Guggenheimella bovis]
MRLKNSYFFTIRENVKDEDSVSGNLLVRAGYVKKSSSGVYMMLPLGLKTLRNIEQIVREEMESTGCQELCMPALISEEVYIDSGRRENFGPSMFSLKDRFGRPFVLGPTHEELFAMAAKMQIKSYKDLPFSLFQFQNKYRDEPRPRFGLIRVREFVMKDSYTFDKDLEGLEKSYQAQFEAYKRIFNRLGMDYVIVRADTGVMGGLLSEEFQALSPMGEDVLVIEENSGYATNVEVAGCVAPEKSTEEHLKYEKVHTPNAKTIEEVASFFGEDPTKFAKTLIYSVDGKPMAFMLRGDHELNETKVQKLLKALEVELAEPEVVVEVTKAPVGFAGPIGLDIPVIVDHTVNAMANFIVGANEKDMHFKNVNMEDFTPHMVADIRNIVEGEMCENGQGPVVFKRGIEVGNTFKLGDKYSKAMGLYYTDPENGQVPVMMGSYGIGIGRCMAALVEQNHTENSILWPKAIAPIKVAIVVINTKDEEQLKIAESIYEELKSKKIDVVLDDRDERPGVKFNDMELVGAYSRITVGKAIKEGKVEFKVQGDEENTLVPIEEIVQKVEEILK